MVRKVNVNGQNVASDSAFQKKYLDRFAVQPLPGLLDTFTAFLQKDFSDWHDIIKALHLKIQ